jgi:heat shock protein HtpX
MTNNLKTAVLLGLMGGLFVAVGYALGGAGGATFALGFAVLFNFGIYFFSDKLALKAARARAVEEHEMPEVYAMVRSLAQRENMPMPRIYFIESQQPNAFATGRNPKHAAVAVTRGILDLMSQAELEGVLAHELAHVRNRDILIATIAATIGAALSFLARMYFWGGMGRRRDNNGASLLVGLAAMILAPLAAAVIQMAISRSREYQADRSGVQTTGSPMALASALAKLEQGSRIPMKVDPAVSQLFIADPLKAFGGRGGRGGRGGGTFTKMFSTHPPIADRIDRLEKMQMGIR